jgi:YhcH/YjgK/YiaL family protein
MILDQIQLADAYVHLHPLFPAAFAGLKDLLQGPWPAARVDLDGDRLYILPMTVEGKGRSAARLEIHRSYIDIQYVVSGTDTMGWRSADAIGTGNGYDTAKDIEFYAAPPVLWVPVPAGHFAVFLPSDAHAPLAGDGTVCKLVVKVRV